MSNCNYNRYRTSDLPTGTVESNSKSSWTARTETKQRFSLIVEVLSLLVIYDTITNYITLCYFKSLCIQLILLPMIIFTYIVHVPSVLLCLNFRSFHHCLKCELPQESEIMLLLLELFSLRSIAIILILALFFLCTYSFQNC